MEKLLVLCLFFVILSVCESRPRNGRPSNHVTENLVQEAKEETRNV